MQKFTVFSIILSLVVVLSITDVLFHDYLSGGTDPSVENVDTAVDTTMDTPSSTDETPLTLPSEQGDLVTPDANPSEQNVELQEVEPIASSLSSSLFNQAGLENPTLKATPFSGLVFQFLDLSDQGNATSYQWNLFSGSAFVGTIYEIKYPTDTGGFQGYLNLRDEAKTMTDIGTVNEVNNYGDASFYFNHIVKAKTVHLLVRVGSSLYGFEYSQSYHESMKNVFDILKSLQ